MNEIFLSVVIPCYDEMSNLRKGVLEKINKYLLSQKYSFEVVVVDDGSKDGSVAFIEKFCKDNPNFYLIQNPHFGKAGAVTTGMLMAKGKFCLFTDMDQATPIEEVEKLLPNLQSGEYDIAIGSRRTIRKGAPFIRQFVSRSNIIVRKLLVGLYDISDTQCGFKLFNAKSAEDLFTSFQKLNKGFKNINGAAVTSGFDVELLYLAKLHGYKIKEVGVEWSYVESRRVSPVTDSVKGLKDLLYIRKNILQKKYSSV